MCWQTALLVSLNLSSQEWLTVRFDSAEDVIMYVEDQHTGMSMRSWWTTFTPSHFWRSTNSCLHLADKHAWSWAVSVEKWGKQLTPTFTHIAHTSPTLSRSSPRSQGRSSSGLAGLKCFDLLWVKINACVARLIICARHLVRCNLSACVRTSAKYPHTGSDASLDWMSSRYRLIYASQTHATSCYYS